jgi:hypothetical protein
MSGPGRKDKSAPLSVRFTETEKLRLQELAGNTPLGVFIRERALGDAAEPRASVRQPVKDGEPLGRLLALLGQSRLANNLNQLAKAANQGSLPVTMEVEADLRAACSEVFEMRILLLKALGIKILQEAKGTLPEVFSNVSGTAQQ